MSQRRDVVMITDPSNILTVMGMNVISCRRKYPSLFHCSAKRLRKQPRFEKSTNTLVMTYNDNSFYLAHTKIKMAKCERCVPLMEMCGGKNVGEEIRRMARLAAQGITMPSFAEATRLRMMCVLMLERTSMMLAGMTMRNGRSTPEQYLYGRYNKPSAAAFLHTCSWRICLHRDRSTPARSLSGRSDKHSAAQQTCVG